MTWDLVADIGGTNMRIAQVADGVMVTRRDFPMREVTSVAQTIASVADDLGGQPRRVVAAGAGPVIQGEIELTNGGWLVSEVEIKAATGCETARVINDFEAAAWSLATLTDTDVQPIGESGPLTDGHRVAVGPGTGLGVGCLIWDGANYAVIPGEGGHVGTGPLTPNDVPVFEKLQQIWPAANIDNTWTFEAEALLSGTGLPHLYQACGGAVDTPGKDIFARAEAGETEALQCCDIFRRQLASVAGNLAVTVNARGGVFLLGGVAQANPSIFENGFWDTFCAGGRAPFTDLRTECGIYLVTIEDFGLRGCVNALQSL